ncbi:MAG TPA: hypothetical protein VGK90_08355 [Rhizomicrobium sp.]|jgi:hypothetical protein
MSQKAIGLFVVALAASVLAGCNQNSQQKSSEHQFVGGGGGGGGRHGIRKICAAEIEKYCANEDRKKRCLRENMDKLGDACKEALAKHRGGRNNNGNGGNNNNGNGGNNNNNNNDDDND